MAKPKYKYNVYLRSIYIHGDVETSRDERFIGSVYAYSEKQAANIVRIRLYGQYGAPAWRFDLIQTLTAIRTDNDAPHIHDQWEKGK